jgi:TorA maturation chaperone TorD
MPNHNPQNQHSDVDEIDAARAQEYTLLSTLLLRSPGSEFLERLRHLPGDQSAIGKAHHALAESAAQTNAESAAREYFALFLGLGRGELLPYASHYLTGFVHGRPLANLRQELQRLGLERAEGQSEPEDHAGVLLEVMAGLAGGGIAIPGATDQEFFEAHLSPWIARFFSDLERASSAQFYAAVGKLGSTFMEIERQAFELTA